MLMAKMVQLSDAAYARLQGLKRREESFSDVVLRLAGRRSLTELSGLRTPKELAEAKALQKDADARDRA